MLDNILIYWVLPSLVTMLLLISWFRDGGDRIEQWGAENWLILLFSSALYPISLIILFRQVVWPWLIKERGK